MPHICLNARCCQIHLCQGLLQSIMITNIEEVRSTGLTGSSCTDPLFSADNRKRLFVPLGQTR
jgi:hypothetical protein